MLPTNFGPEKTFIHFDLELSENEKSSLDALNIDCLSHYENYGDLALIPNEVNNYITSLGKDNAKIAETVTLLVGRLTQKVLEITGQETAWISMRGYTPNPTFKKPRWHADRYDYPPTEGREQLKAAITLKGASTLFYNSDPIERAKLEEFKSNRPALREKLDPSKVVSADAGQGSLFIMGAPYAPIHSEPDIEKPRLFLSMIPGNHDQIRGIYHQTPEKTIVSLLIPYGLYCYFVGPRLKGNDDFGASPYEDTEIIVFKLPNEEEPGVLNTISAIITSHNHEMKAEIIVKDQTLLKITFPFGAVISISDISKLFLDNKHRILSESDIYSLLKEYSAHCRELDKLNSHIPEYSRRGFTFNPCEGRNTVGLFRPQSSQENNKSRENFPPPPNFQINV